jgi:hypothetical protein
MYFSFDVLFDPPRSDPKYELSNRTDSVEIYIHPKVCQETFVLIPCSP